MADDQDFDQTQALFLDEFEQEIDEDNVSDNKNSVAFLKVSCQKSFPEKSFPLYEGNNVIGRHEESCNVCISLKGLSREHACIEIKGESFLIYDKNSRNKTKRNQLYLSPDVRYELKNGDTLMFGDVTCKFYIGNKDVDAVSETGSESEYQTANDVKDVTVEFEEDYDSDNSVDLLQPTQAYTNHTQRHNATKSLLADDSFVEKETTVLVGETPAPARQKVTSGPVIDDSGSETEDEDALSKNVPQTLVIEGKKKNVPQTLVIEGKKQNVPQTLVMEGKKQNVPKTLVMEGKKQYVPQTLVMEGKKQNVPQTLVIEDTQKDESGDAEILYAQTQAYVGESDVGDVTDEEDKKLLTEPTQAFTDVQDRQQIEPTQTFVAESDEEEEDDRKKALQYGATQAYHTDYFDEPTQTTEDEGETVVESDEDVSHLFATSTLACDVDDFPEEGGRQVITADDTVDQEMETQAILDEPTQAVDGGDEATQVFPDVRVNGDDATQVVKEVACPSKKVAFDDATVAVQEDATVAVQEEATVIVQDDATVAVQEDATVAVHEDATLAVQDDATVAVHGDATVNIHGDATVDVHGDATLALPEATVSVHGDATVAFHGDATLSVHGDATLALQGDSTVAIQEEATLAIQGDTVAVAEDATTSIQDAATVAIQDDTSDAVQDDATLAVPPDTTDIVEDDHHLGAQTKGKGRGRPKRSETASIKSQDNIDKAATSKGKRKAPVKQTAKAETDMKREDSVTSSQESDDGNIRRSSRSKRKSFRMLEMEQSMDDMKGIDKSIRKGEDYSPEISDTDDGSPKRGHKPTKTAGQSQEKDIGEAETLTLSVEEEIALVQKNIPPLPKETVKKTEAEFLMSLPALQDKESPAPVLTEATQAYTLEPEEELPQPEMVEATQPYVLSEDDSTPLLDEGGSKEERDTTPPIEEVLAATQNYSLEEEVVADSEETDIRSPLISIPSRSPLKPTLVSPDKREKKSPSPKRVQFTVKKIDSSSTSASENNDIPTDSETAEKTEQKNTSTNRPSRSKVKEAIIKKVRNKRTAEAKSHPASQGENENLTEGKKGRQSVLSEQETNKTETKTTRRSAITDIKTEEHINSKADQSANDSGETTKITRGRRSTALIENVKSEDTASTSKGRGRKSTATRKETNKGVKKEDKTETVALISDGENEDLVKPANGGSQGISTEQVDKTGEPETLKTFGSSGKFSVQELSEPGTSHSETSLAKQDEKIIENKPETKRSRGRKVKASIDPVVDNEKETVIENVDIDKRVSKTIKGGRRGRSSVVPEMTDKARSEAEEFKASKSAGRRGRSVAESESNTTTNNDTGKTDDVITKQTGRRGRTSVLGESKNMSETESQESYAGSKTTKQTGRRGRTSVLRESESKNMSETESQESDAGSNTKRAGRRGSGRTSVSGESESRNSCETESRASEAVSKTTKQTGRRGRTSVLLEESEGKNSCKTESQESEAESKRGKSKALGSTSEAQNKQLEVSKDDNRGRRGRSSVLSGTENKDELMLPPKSGGRRGKKNADDSATSEIQNNRGTSRQSKVNEFINENEKEKSFNLDIHEKDKSESSDSNTRGRSSSRTRKIENKEIVKENYSKPTNIKRKRDSSINVSDVSPSTSKRAKIAVNTNVLETKTTQKSKGRTSNVRNDSPVEEDTSRSSSRTSTHKSDHSSVSSEHSKEQKTMKSESKKRGRSNDENVSETPAKKTRVKEEQSTPKQNKTLAVSSPSLRRKSVEPNKPKVMFTGVVDEHGQKIIKDLGGEFVNSVQECTHLVTDKVRRTVKFLCCLARGIPIVTLQWIESCKQSAMFVDCHKFPVKDTATEKQYKFSLSRSLENAKESCLLQGYKVHVTKSVKPEPSQMEEIIECAGGQYLTTMPKKGGDNIVIVSCPDDESLCTAVMKAGVPVVNSEFILTGILRQEVNINSYPF
ncbi:mediator of DNA damage checkpoint protein 1-like isoform X2 [Mytilus californianus]|uniref:mediator of DNA damage checkpoint protein 1-like isoform X2 n=1 Tax=Mytilus californianus TaxID=6549 RepID=UPI002247C029|nr:mediator of DNA damage checkpoint protein 1-like isoform X2 [Mytilus californianus]